MSSPAVHDELRFHRHDGAGDVLIDTTRPELHAPVAVAHPEDDRYKPLFDTLVSTPLYGVSVPVVAHRLADPEKGTGAAMICTFTDVVWWRELQLPTRAIIGAAASGRSLPKSSSTAGRACTWRSRARTSSRPRRSWSSSSARSGQLEGEPRAITHPVAATSADRPLEIVTSRQWYYRNGGR